MKHYLVFMVLAVILVASHVYASDEKRTYAMLAVGWMASQDNYALSYDYRGDYEGYDTTILMNAVCFECTDSVSGLKKRPVVFAGESDMTLSSGYNISLEIGREFARSIGVELEFSFISREEDGDGEDLINIDSWLWALICNVSYMLFVESMEAIRPYISVGVGLAGYDADGDFRIAAFNTVRGVSGIPTLIHAQGSFGDLSSFNLITKAKFGLLFPIGEDKEIDFGIQYLAVNTMTNIDESSAYINAVEEVTQDPGAAQNPGHAGCSGNTAQGCNALLSPTRSTPVEFGFNSLAMSNIQFGGVLFDLGIKIYF